MMDREKSCKARVKRDFKGRLEASGPIFNAEEQTTEELGNLNEYGLAIDFVGAGTFEKQREDYIRYQLSWGGPSEEFRIFKNGEVEFWLLDWFDGASCEVSGADAETIKEIVRDCRVEAADWEL